MPGTSEITSFCYRKFRGETTILVDRSVIGEPVMGLEEKQFMAAIDVPLGNVRYGAGLTISLGRGTFEFARVDVAMQLPCAADPDAIEEVYNIAKSWVDDKVNAELAYYRKQGGA